MNRKITDYNVNDFCTSVYQCFVIATCSGQARGSIRGHLGESLPFATGVVLYKKLGSYCLAHIIEGEPLINVIFFIM